MLDDYFSREAILYRLCKARVNLARQRGKSHLNHLISSDKKLNYHSNNSKSTRHKGEEVDFITSIMPPRRKWISPTREERYPNRSIQRINSLKYNTIALLKTIKHYKKNNPTEPFLLKLENFIDEIISEFDNENFNISAPTIIAKLKNPEDKKDKTCRPICVFPLKEKIIISIVNKYLTNAFNDIFYDHSYAFKAKKDAEQFPPTHHNAIEYILDFKKKYKGKRLWVSECDISKFFDTVNHKVVREEFKKIVHYHNKKITDKIDDRAISIFHKYLKCYDFQKDVFSLNYNQNFWISNKKEGCKFKWVERDLLELGCYKNIKRHKIGIPQGGALSGLIANIVLHSIDLKINAEEDKKLCYVRFCDDMILIHSIKKICQAKTKLYFEGLKDLKLISHEAEYVKPSHKKEFWNKSKSKSPYKWSTDHIKSFNRIGFVGYEICYDGSLRVRKSSLIKEKRKIKNLVLHTLSALKNGKRKSDEMIIESISNKLVGMSVGRVTMKNYKVSDNDMCWVNGFTLLQDNPDLRTQLKRLDHYRSKHLSRFKKKLSLLPEVEVGNSNGSKRVGKIFFIRIEGLNYIDSENIRLELQRINILNVKFLFTKSKKKLLLTNPTALILSSKYLPFQKQIIELLLKDEKDDRDVPHYGKPFSYYYNVIEKN